MVKINCETAKGGAVEFSKCPSVWASYAVAGVADTPPAELFYGSVQLDSGRTVKLFVNRETGLVVVDVVGVDGGNEILRAHANRYSIPGRKPKPLRTA